jgi:type IX secretion system PorP/SprF family membrane protein
MSLSRLLLLSGILLGCVSVATAQQLSLFTQYRENATLINPAAMETDFLSYGYNLSFGASYRKQWAGISGSPETQSVRASYVNKNSSGVSLLAGGYVLNDQTGPTGFTGVYGRIGAVIGGDPEYSGLSLAITGGYVSYAVRASEIRLRDEGDIIGMVDQTQSHPDVGFGIYYYAMDRADNMFYAGVSVPQILGFDLTYQDGAGEYSVQRVQHVYAMTGYHFLFDNDGILELSAWGKYVENAPFNADFNLRYQTPSAFYLGAGMSTAGNAHLEAGLVLGDNVGLDNIVRIGYGLDYSFSSFGPSVGNTHELQVSFSLDR